MKSDSDHRKEPQERENGKWLKTMTDVMITGDYVAEVPNIFSPFVFSRNPVGETSGSSAAKRSTVLTI